MFRTLFVIASMFTAFQAYADTVTGSANAFTGPNVYSPTVLYDSQQNNYKMWYGGWQLSGQQNDHIYYRTSSDGVNWSSNYTEVLTPSSVTQAYYQSTNQSVNFTHVNDPSVTKAFNSVSNTYQYTMFFTACVSPCTQGSNNSIWSTVSNDGINWFYPKPLNIVLPASVSGPQNPSAIYDPSRALWYVYFSVSTDVGTSNVYFVNVNGNRDPTNNAYSVANFGIGIQNPTVTIIGSNWYLAFNTPNKFGGYDIYYSVSATSTWNTASPLIVTDNNPFCAVDTPMSLPTSSTTYYLYFATIPKSANGSCDFTQNQIMALRAVSR